jgi:hypothetical protein
MAGRFHWLLCCSSLLGVSRAHTCIGEPRAHRLRSNHPPNTSLPSLGAATCKGGLCLGQVNGPHWHDWHNGTGNASYPVGSPSAGFTHFSSTMTVPEYPRNKSGICYYMSVIPASRPPLAPSTMQLNLHAMAGQMDGHLLWRCGER